MQTRNLMRARDGASAVEFAIVAPIFFFLMMAIMEFGLFMFHKVAIESITMQVGREASLNVASGNDPECASAAADRLAYIRCYVERKAAYLINGDRVTVNINTVARGGTRAPDICLGNGSAPPASSPTCSGAYEDVNGNGVYDPPASNNSVGSAGDLIEVRVSYPWRVLVPYMSRVIGSQQEDGSRTNVVLITSSTVFRNEPE
jgi:Flp pilus assembly protein TadG